MPYDSTTYSSRTAAGAQGRTRAVDAVFAALCAHAGGDGRVAASHSTLMIWAGYQREAVNRAIQELLTSGKIERERLGKSKARPSIYRILEQPNQFDAQSNQFGYKHSENKEEIPQPNQFGSQSNQFGSQIPQKPNQFGDKPIEKTAEKDQSNQFGRLARVDNPPARVRVVNTTSSSLQSEEVRSDLIRSDQTREALADLGWSDLSRREKDKFLWDLREALRVPEMAKNATAWWTCDHVIAALITAGATLDLIRDTANRLGAQGVADVPPRYLASAVKREISEIKAISAEPEAAQPAQHNFQTNFPPKGWSPEVADSVTEIAMRARRTQAEREAELDRKFGKGWRHAK